ncbi:MAG: molybdopterin-binding protein [Thermoproteota archaeon]|nr:molybdopterin-binding protein [Thermoproteota archaeon]
MAITSNTQGSQSDMLEVNVELISVGNELLSGTIANTNAQWLSTQITQAGGIVKRITVLGDCYREISFVIQDSIERAPDWLILSGGLGPTYDDQTLRGLSSALGRRLKLNPRAIEMLRKSYTRYKQRLVPSDSKLNEIRLKMAKIPRGSVPLQNPVGSAPAVYIDVKNGVRDGSRRGVGTTRVVCLPGVPKEMEAIFTKKILPQLKRSVGKYYFLESMFETVGVGESMLAPTLSKLAGSYPSEELYVKTHPKGYKTNFLRNEKTRLKPKPEPKLNIQIVSKGEDKLQVKERYDLVFGALREEIRKLGGKILVNFAQRSKTSSLT